LACFKQSPKLFLNIKILDFFIIYVIAIAFLSEQSNFINPNKNFYYLVNFKYRCKIDVK
jgi:hypothetical protein